MDAPNILGPPPPGANIVYGYFMTMPSPGQGAGGSPGGSPGNTCALTCTGPPSSGPVSSSPLSNARTPFSSDVSPMGGYSSLSGVSQPPWSAHPSPMGAVDPGGRNWSPQRVAGPATPRTARFPVQCATGAVPSGSSSSPYSSSGSSGAGGYPVRRHQLAFHFSNSGSSNTPPNSPSHYVSATSSGSGGSSHFQTGEESGLGILISGNSSGISSSGASDSRSTEGTQSDAFDMPNILISID